MRTSLLLLLAAAVACGGEKAAVKTSSQPKPPAWLAKAPASGDALFFTGAKEGASSLEEGKDSAAEAARGEAAKYIGVEISAEHRDVMSTEEAENKARDEVNTRAQGVVRSAEIADVYYERISREVGSGTIDRYDVWVLIRIPRAEIAKERARQDDEQKQAAQTAAARFHDGQGHEQQGDMLGALIRYRDAIKMLKPVGASVATGDAAAPTAGRVLQLAQDAASLAQGKVRRAVIAGPDWAAGAVTEALSKQGFTARTTGDEGSALAAARADGTPYVIVVKATTAPGGNVFAQVAASAALDVRALDARSGAVVASAQKTAKAVGRTPAAAQQAAASEAGLGAGGDLAAALVAKENAGF